QINRAISDAVNEIGARLDKRVDALRPHGLKKALFTLREWGILAVIFTSILALLALASSQFYYANQRVAAEAKFEANAADALKAINAHLKKIDDEITLGDIHRAAVLPQSQFDEELPRLSSTLSSAIDQNTNVPAQVIKAVGRKLLTSTTDAPGYWPAVSRFISFRSGELGGWSTLQSPLPLCTDKAPEPSRVLATTPSGQFSISDAIYENCTFVLDSPR